MLAVLTGMFILTGCSDSPKDVAVKWGNALLDGDAKKANEYSTENTVAANALLIGILSNGEKSEKDRKNFSETISKWKDGTEEINGDTAKVYGPGGPKDGSVDLKKVDGKWKVDMKK